jgi:hypothetical protein
MFCFHKDHQYKPQQLWKRGEPNSEGYFRLENSILPKFMTAISSSALEIKGKLTVTTSTNLAKPMSIKTIIWFWGMKKLFFASENHFPFPQKQIIDIIDFPKLVEVVAIRGELISKCPFGVFKSPKKPMKFF